MAPTTRAAGWLRLSSRTAIAHRRLLAGLAVLALGFSLLLTGIAGFLSISATDQAVRALDAVGESQRTTIVQARVGDDPAGQRAAADDAIRFALDESAVRVDTEEFTEGGEEYVRWTFTPHPTGFTAAAIPALITGLDSLQRVFSADPAIATSGVTADGSLTTTLADIQRRLGAEQGASLVPLALVAIIGVVALGQVSRLQAAARAPELGLIRSRGASFRRLGLTAGLETAAVTLPATVLGALTALLTLVRLFPAIAVDATLWLIPASITLTASAIVAASTVAAARSASLRDPAFASRGRTAIGAISLVLVLVVAGLSFWQFTLAGSPADPFSSAAPALVLLALVLLGLSLFGPAARLAETVTARSRGVRPSLPIRQVARRVGLHAVSVTVVALAVGSMVIAAGYSETLERVSGLPQLVRTGTDVRVSAGPSGLPELDGLDAVPAFVTAARVGGDSAELVGLPATELASVMTTVDGTVDTGTIARQIAVSPRGVAVDGDVTVSVTAGERQPDPYGGAFGDVTSEPVRVTITTIDERGVTRTTAIDAFDPPAAGRTVTRTIAPPAGDALLAADVTVGGLAAHEITVKVGAAGVDGDWTLVVLSNDFFGTAPADGSVPGTVVFSPWSTAVPVRLVAPGIDPVAPVPAVIGAALAERLTLVDGDVVTLRSDALGDEFDVAVAGVAPTIPGTTSNFGVVADLGAIETRLLGVERPASTGDSSVNQYWIASEDAAATAALLAPRLGDATITTSTMTQAAMTPTQLALGLGAIGALFLAGATLLAGNGMVSRARGGELRVLRALGMRRREIGAARRLEVVVVVAFAVVLGAASGVLVSILAVANLARSATIGLPSTLGVALAFDPALLLVGAAGAFIVLGVVALIAGAQSLSREDRE
jgi:hypothetical protein